MDSRLSRLPLLGASKESKGGSPGSRVEGFLRVPSVNPCPVSSARSFLWPTCLPLAWGGGSRPPKAPRSGLWAWRRRSDPKTLREGEEKTNTATFFSLRSPGTHLREVRSYNASRPVGAKRTNFLLFFRIPKAEEQASHPNSRRARHLYRTPGLGYTISTRLKRVLTTGRAFQSYPVSFRFFHRTWRRIAREHPSVTRQNSHQETR